MFWKRQVLRWSSRFAILMCASTNQDLQGDWDTNYNQELLGSMGEGSIDCLWTGVKATYTAIFATSFATVRSSCNTGLHQFQQESYLWSTNTGKQLMQTYARCVISWVYAVELEPPIPAKCVKHRKLMAHGVQGCLDLPTPPAWYISLVHLQDSSHPS